jgi:hypothetical protein
MEPMPMSVAKQMKPEVMRLEHSKRKDFAILATWNYFYLTFIRALMH